MVENFHRFRIFVAIIENIIRKKKNDPESCLSHMLVSFPGNVGVASHIAICENISAKYPKPMIRGNFLALNKRYIVVVVVVHVCDS